MDREHKLGRRDFLKRAAGAVGAATQAGGWPTLPEALPGSDRNSLEAREHEQHISFPRVFSGEQLKNIAFPLGGVGAGSLSLGGRGQLRDWEIFNRPNKGFSPQYAFPSICIQAEGVKPVARVLEARILPPYGGQDGLGSKNAPGLSRIETAEFTGAYPLAHLRFEDPALPVNIELDAFSPFIPHDPDDSGLPVAILRYRVSNPGSSSAKVSIAYSIDNPVNANGPGVDRESRLNQFRVSRHMEGLVMSNPGLAADDPMQGNFVLAALSSPNSRITNWRGWPKGRWWNSPMLFWDAFSRDGALLDEPKERNSVGAVCQQKAIAAGETAVFPFLLAWYFPNRTPDWCGWSAPPGEGKTVIGNYYCARFKDAWEAAEYAAANLDRLEGRTRAFANAFADSTLPAEVKEAASANLSTLASTTCFRTADGKFHGFEGSDDQIGCCFGNCTHVWNYETATAYLFPSYARSLREDSFGYSMDDAGAIHFRQFLPEGKARSGFAAADGQMGQIIHAYMDWKLSGDSAWLERMWPRIKKALEFAWVPGGWDANRDGVLEGVQHNTYDVEFYGPNPLCGVYYLGALRAGEEMARAVQENSSADEYRKLFNRGSGWIDAHLFQGEYYIQQVRGYRPDQIAAHLRGDMGSEDTEHPQYQAGSGCMADQLVGQYLAHVAGLGPLVSEEHVRAALESIYRYNYKRTLIDHDCVQRTYALNDESAVLICDYGRAQRPHIPFPYYAEAWTGVEHSVAALMFYAGMSSEAVEYIRNVRLRYDGKKRNPWDEPECGHHYARAMASWSSVVALSGFRYAGDRAEITAMPPLPQEDFHCFWATGTGWGTYSLRRNTGGGAHLTIRVLAGALPCRSCTLGASGSRISARNGSATYSPRMEQANGRTTLRFASLIHLVAGAQLEVEVGV